jgi:hypothetical protein
MGVVHSGLCRVISECVGDTAVLGLA